MLEYTLYGDLDQDDFLSNNDVYKILESVPQKLIGYKNGVPVETIVPAKSLTKQEYILADIDNDNIASARDANFIEQYLFSKQNYLNGKSDLFVKEAFPLVEFIARKNNLKLLQEVDKYKDLENQKVRRELLNNGASDKEIISTWLYDAERDKPEVNIDDLSEAEIIQEMLYNNIENDLRYDLDNSGNITNNDYLIARGLTPDNSINEAEQYIMSELENINENNITNEFIEDAFIDDDVNNISDYSLPNVVKLPLPNNDDNFIIPSVPDYPINIVPIDEPIFEDDNPYYELPNPPRLPLPEDDEIIYNVPIAPDIPNVPIITEIGNKINIDKNLLIAGAFIVGLLIARGK
jgi:hypothetical protein